MAQAARMLGISRNTLAQMCDDGEVDHAVLVRTKKLRRISRAEVDRLREMMKRSASRASRACTDG